MLKPTPGYGKPLKKILELARDKNVDLWALDEVHFQQHGSRCRMWIPPESKDPVLLHHPTRRSVGYFGALRLRDGKLASRREENCFNGESFFSFLKKVRQISSHSGGKVVIIMDNARYHHAKLHAPWRQSCEERFHIEFLPPYSPDLNPIERVWKLTRRLMIHNRYFPSIDDVITAVEDLFAQWHRENDTLKKLCAII